MEGIYRLRNTVQNYVWGSTSAIPALFGIPNPDDNPMAEIWMGAHPKAPSVVLSGDGEIPLNEFIARDPAGILGEETARRYERHLPFLFKVLSAAEPLSIQAHPTRRQAADGYAAEDAKGIAVDAPERNYRDRNHKPEIICALTPFHALRGFRPVHEIILEFEKFGSGELTTAFDRLCEVRDADGLRSFFRALQSMSPEAVNDLAHRFLEGPDVGTDLKYIWLEKLAAAYPGDPGIFAPLYLNLVKLSPGEAMFLPAGELHAYLEGTGIELMANSDNVLRGGLTVKHVDVDELERVLTFDPGIPRILHPREEKKDGGTVGTYETPADEFSLAVIDPAGGRIALRPDSAEILICTEGDGIAIGGDGESIQLKAGDAVFVTASAPEYRIEGKGRLYRAAVGHENLG